MPEGHTVHRLAAAFESAFGGQQVRTSSPQGRFSEAAQLDGRVLLGAEAVGKHLFLPFAPSADVDREAPVVRHVHIHLGLYGSWTFMRRSRLRRRTCDRRAATAHGRAGGRAR